MSIPCAMHVLYAMTNDGPGHASASTQRLGRLQLVGTHRDLRDVGVAVRTGDRAEVLLAAALAGSRELRHRGTRCRLRCLTTRVGVDLGVQHEDVDVPTGGQHLVDAAEADVVGPTVAADDPHSLANERAGEREQVRRIDDALCRERREPTAQLCDTHALRVDLRLGCLRIVEQRPHEVAIDLRLESCEQCPGVRCAARRAPAACRSRTRRCPRTTSCSTRGRGRRPWSPTESSAGWLRRSTSSRSHWRRSCGRRTAA